MKVSVPAQTLDSLHRGAVSLNREHEARAHRLAVEDDRTGAAVADVAALLRAGEAGFVAQRIEQRAIALHGQLAALAVDGERDRLAHRASSHARSSARRVRTSTISLR